MTAPNNIPFADWTVSPQRTVTLAENGSLPCVCSDGVSALAIARQTVWDEYGSINDPTPDAWVTYLKALMAIVNGTDTTITTLPTAPAS